jgi:AhpD family alkylhydroperoxidase
MPLRPNPFTAVRAAPGPMLSCIEFSKGALQCGLEDSLAQFVTIRVSQINRCAASIDTHDAARELGETSNVYICSTLGAPHHSIANALRWAEALTRLSETHAPDDAYRALCDQFTNEERANLTLLNVAICNWNCIQLDFRALHPATQRRAAR